MICVAVSSVDGVWARNGEMNLILMVLRLALSVLFPSRRDGLSLAARTDGRMEHVPQNPWAWQANARTMIDCARAVRLRPAAERAKPVFPMAALARPPLLLRPPTVDFGLP